MSKASKPVASFREWWIDRKNKHAYEKPHQYEPLGFDHVIEYEAVEALTQCNQELELALLKYGRHDSDCVALRIYDEFDAVRLCECGFSKALSMDREK